MPRLLDVDDVMNDTRDATPLMAYVATLRTEVQRAVTAAAERHRNVTFQRGLSVCTCDAAKTISVVCISFVALACLLCCCPSAVTATLYLVLLPVSRHGNVVSCVAHHEASFSSSPWYHGQASREAAASLLAGRPDGEFVVSENPRESGTFLLDYRWENANFLS